MSKMPKMNLWIDAFNSDTSFLSDEELGIYFRLIFFAWSREGYIPDDIDFIASLTRNGNKEAIEKIIKLYWTKENDQYYQKRLKEEYIRAVETTEINKLNGKKGGEANAKRIRSERLTESEASISISKSISISNKDIIDKNFNKFWEDVCYKISKGQARRNYCKLHKDWWEEPQTLAKKYNNYYNSLKDKQYAQYPSTWLNAEGFLNEGVEIKDQMTDKQMKDWKLKGDVEMRKKGIKPLSWSVNYIRELDEFIEKNDS
jgi:uncharacterized protein YdaU (DUF1376 family)